MKIKFSGRVKNVFLTNLPDSLEAVPADFLELDYEGIKGDKHSGFTRPSCGRTPWYDRGTEIRNCRQISAVSTEEIAEIAKEMDIPQILPEWIGSNINIEGVENFTSVPLGSRIFFSGGSVIKVEEKNGPCVFAGKAIHLRYPEKPNLAGLFPVHAKQKRGLVCTVEKPGILRPEETFNIRVP